MTTVPEAEAWREHRFIRYADQCLLTKEASEIAAYVLNRWLKPEKDISVSKFRRENRLELVSTPQNGPSQTITVRFEDMVERIRKTRSFKAEDFGLPPLECDWLDMMSMAKPDAPIATADFSEFAKFALPLRFGQAFPLAPCIDREGAMFASFQGPIQENIVSLHRHLVDESHLITALKSHNDLRMLLNEAVSLIDITLHQLYFMAQYRAQEMGWRFEPDKLGPRRGQRLTEKLGWVHKITRRALDAQEELPAFHRLRAVRNHFNHFDPPCMAYTVEDVVDWLNDVPLVGRLAWKIRKTASAQLSSPLVEIITLPRAEFVPRFPEYPRVRQGKDVGYASVVWPATAEGPMTEAQAQEIATLINRRNELARQYKAADVLAQASSYEFELRDGKVAACIERKKVQWYQWEVCHLSVQETWEGQGLAFTVYSRAEAAARSAGAGLLQCTIREGNNDSEKFFGRQGFAKVKTFHYPATGNNVGIWQKVLRPAEGNVSLGIQEH